MSIRIAGQDRSADIGVDIERSVDEKISSTRFLFLPWGVNALSLSQVTDEDAFAARYLELLRYKNQVSAEAFEIPSRAGLRGRITRTVKTFLWKLLRYQHDRFIFRQNAINSLMTGAFEFQARSMQTHIDELQAQIDELKAAADAKGQSHE